ncbi:OsmC family protein [Fervidibacillus halotolerans]|uniref:OsmC family protein n=1 Tax=Fervidibacillus halotolerans TaxID=2980027 RepID=A0A9E8RZI6_9BACI|nr:OsmC family protein [Fervidibacillus halotolerans]WAA13383.1 OsmC family protein [Fervidibacillus halotolerans]
MNQPLVTLRVKGKVESGITNTIQVRNLAPVLIDEPIRLGGKDQGPNPLEYLLATLGACATIIAHDVAKEQQFTYKRIDYSVSGKLDPRGYKGVEGVKTYFQSIRLDVFVETDENEEALQRVAEISEGRCPIYNLLKDAGVEIESNWVKKQ